MNNCGKTIFSFIFDDGSDDEKHHQRVIETIVHYTSLEYEATKHGGSVVGRVYKNRERENRHRNLMSDYFVERPHFNITDFPRSPLFNDVVHGVAPHVEYIVSENQYHLGYYLADGIYPRWATLVKTISSPDNPKKRLFVQTQGAYKKDVEREFGILQARWAIVRGPARMGCKDKLHSIMITCIILHNIIVEDEYEYVEEESDDEDMCPQ
ncbi:unnamed protein product [Prunus brigantina]